jgi:hypothetical protein
MPRIAFDEFEEYDLEIDRSQRPESFFDLINSIVDKEIDAFKKSIGGNSKTTP